MAKDKVYKRVDQLYRHQWKNESEVDRKGGRGPPFLAGPAVDANISLPNNFSIKGGERRPIMQFIKITEACEMFGIGRHTMYRRLTSKKWTGYKDGIWYVNPDQLEKEITGGGTKKYKRRKPR